MFALGYGQLMGGPIYPPKLESVTMETGMENKSKLSRLSLTRVMLQALLLLLVAPISAFAATEANQEIGVPQAMQAPVKGCFGAVLSPDGDHFYSVREGLLTQYKINPFKKLGSVAIDWEQLTERRDATCRVLITSDKSKLIIVHRHKLFLLDINSGRVLKNFERKDWDIGTVGATLNNAELLILDMFLSDEQGDVFHLSIWDANTLKFKSEIRDLGKTFGLFPDRKYAAISKIQDRIYLATGKSLVVVNAKTYAPELTLSFRPSGHDPKISKNFQTVYVWSVSAVTDHLSGKHTTYGDTKAKSVLVFDQTTRESRFENMNSIPREEIDPILISTHQLSRTREYVMVSQGPLRALAVLANLNTGMVFQFSQYESGEAILMERRPGGEYKNFQLTPGAKKYLMIKDRAGKVVPINDAMFMKYHVNSAH